MKVNSLIFILKNKAIKKTLILNLSGMRYQSIHLITISYLFNNKGCFFRLVGPRGELGAYQVMSISHYYIFCYYIIIFPIHKRSMFLISTYLALYFSNLFLIFCHFHLCLFFLICVISGIYSEDILPYCQ